MNGYELYDKTRAPTPLPKTSGINGLPCTRPIRPALRSDANAYIAALDVYKKSLNKPDGVKS